MEKITKRETYEAIINFMNGGNLEFTNKDEEVVSISKEYVASFAEKEIELLDKKAVKAKERAAQKRAEKDELAEVVKSVMSTEEFETIADIAAKVIEIEGEEVTAAKVQYRLGQFVKLGEAEKTEITIPATEETKARKVMAYRKFA